MGEDASDFAPDAPVVLIVEAAHGQIIHAATEAAPNAARGAGARLTDARALDPELVAVPADPGRRCRRWSSGWRAGRDAGRRWSRSMAPIGLRLDVTGVAHLFGGEAGWPRTWRRLRRAWR